MIPHILSIAGSDPSGGAGIQADLKTFSALRCYGMAAITALTAQNTQGVSGVHVPPAEFVAAQISAIFADVRVDGVKIGMLASGEIVRAVARELATHKPKIIILDPVLVATSGDSLGAPDVVEAMQEYLFPLATLITPNLPEALRLAGAAEGTPVEALGATLLGQGARAVLIKGGHAESAEAIDDLFWADKRMRFAAARVPTKNTHGTGCTLSSAICCHMALGLTLADAVAASKTYLTGAIFASDGLLVGTGHGPVHHFHALWT